MEKYEPVDQSVLGSEVGWSVQQDIVMLMFEYNPSQVVLVEMDWMVIQRGVNGGIVVFDNL